MNGNGVLSLAEVDKALQLKLPGLFEIKPVLIRAFNAAKALFPDRRKSDGVDDDDFVTKKEFKYLLRYLRQYYEFWVAFD